MAVVTGAGRGQGRAVSLLFGREGASVVVYDIGGELAEETARLIEREGGRALAVMGDVAEPESVRGVMEAAVVRFGGIHILYNNAAIFLPDEDIDVTVTPGYALDRLIDVNLKGVFHCCKYGIPYLIDAGGGSVVNVSSTLGLASGGLAPAYSACKGAVIALTKNIAGTFGPRGVRANVICPAMVDTPMIEYYLRTATRKELGKEYPLGRIGEPEDIAKLALFLASDESSWITGTVITIDGGRMA